MPDKVVATQSLNGHRGFVYQLDLVHREANSDFGGFLSLEMKLCDSTDTETRSVQIINTISVDDLDDMLDVFSKIRDAAIERQSQIDNFNQARQVLTAASQHDRG